MWLSLNRLAYFEKRAYTVSGSFRTSNSGNYLYPMFTAIPLLPRRQFNVELTSYMFHNQFVKLLLASVTSYVMMQHSTF